MIMNTLELQQKLNRLGFNHLEEDGEFGPLTRNVLYEAQRSFGIEADGIPGPITQAEIDKRLPTTGTTPSGTYDHWQQLTEHFNRHEFSCECDWEGGPGYCDGYPVDINEDFVRRLEELRVHCGFPFIITSGVRCGRLNEEVGGVWDSRHKMGLAADVAVYAANGLSVSAFAQIARDFGLITIEYEEQSFVHLQWPE